MKSRARRYVLGIDVGTSATKVLLVAETGKIEAVVEVPYEVSSPHPGWNEQHPDLWWNATRHALKKLGFKKSAALKRVVAIGVTGQMHGSVFLDARRKVIRPALLWNDQRTTKECQEIEESAGSKAQLFDWVNNAALTGYTLPKILWLRNHEPKNFKKLDKVLLPKDWIVYQLTNELTSDVSDASGTLLLDVEQRKWSSELLDAVKLESKVLPRLYESSDIVGTVSPKIAEELGLTNDVVVVAGAGDQPAAAVGMGIVMEGQVSATIGTSGVVFAAVDRFVTNSSDAIQSFCSAISGRWCVFGCMLTAGGALDWYLNSVFGGKTSFDKLIKNAERSPKGSKGLVFLPYLDGERCPYPNPSARGGWIGLRREHDASDMTRSLMEGVTFGLKDQIGLLESIGIEVQEIRSSGGGAKSRFWLGVQADVFEKTVLKLQTPHASAMGAALLAMTGAQIYKSIFETCTKLVVVEERVYPERKGDGVYQEAYERYHSLYPKLTPWFGEHYPQ